MNTALVYRRSRRWLVWAAFAFAAGIHIAVIMVAQGKSDKSVVQDIKPDGVEIDIVNTQQEEALPEDVTMSPPPRTRSCRRRGIPGGESNAATGSPSQENARCVFCERHVGSARKRESVGDVCAAPGISVRGATSANNRVGYRAANNRSGERQCGRCSDGAELRKCDS